MQLCEAPPWPIDPVVVVECQARLSVPHGLPAGVAHTWRTKFSTLIRDVDTIGNSGSGVFDPKSQMPTWHHKHKVHVSYD
jgi:hypothetical protein